MVLALAGERDALSPVASNVLCLEGAVEAFDVGVVVGSCMSCWYSCTLHLLLEVTSILLAIVCLYHSDTKRWTALLPCTLRVKDSVGSSSRRELGR